jgi:hypothetical protein
MTGRKPISICSQSILGVNAVNILVDFYNIHDKHFLNRWTWTVISRQLTTSYVCSISHS